METFTERYYKKQLHTKNTQFVLLGIAFVFVSVVFALVTCLYVKKLSDSRLVINCTSLGSSAAQFVQDNPQYLKRLDRNKDGIPCNSTSNG